MIIDSSTGYKAIGLMYCKELTDDYFAIGITTALFFRMFLIKDKGIGLYFTYSSYKFIRRGSAVNDI
jgi:hypothetical protein